MPIHPKPFQFSQFLRRILFKDRPAFFNVVDLNKEFLLIHSFVEEFNKQFGVSSNLTFNVTNFTEVAQAPNITRTSGIAWNNGYVLYKGVRLDIPAGNVNGFQQVYPIPNENVVPKGVKPPLYVVLTATLGLVNYGQDPILGGIQADEYPNSAPSVDVEQYSNFAIKYSIDPANEPNILCVLATIHPKYDVNGVAAGYGFLYNIFRNPNITIKHNGDRAVSVMQGNQSLFEYLTEKTLINANNVYNELQLIKRFDLADLSDAEKARHNIGFGDLTGYKQLAAIENFADLSDVALARQNLGLKNPATRAIGLSKATIARGDILPVRSVVIWTGPANTIPDNWALCNGQTLNGVTTPDMSGAFVVGVDQTVPKFGTIGGTGGNGGGILKLLRDHLPKFKLRFNVVKSTSGGWKTDGGSGTPLMGAGGANTTSNGLVAIGDGGETEELGQGEDIDITPKFYVVAFIMFCGYVDAAASAEPAAIVPAQITYPNFTIPNSATDNGYADAQLDAANGNSGSAGSGISITNPD